MILESFVCFTLRTQLSLSWILDFTSPEIECNLLSTCCLLWLISCLRLDTVDLVSALYSLILANTTLELVIISCPCLSSYFVVCTMCAFTLALISTLKFSTDLFKLSIPCSLSFFSVSSTTTDLVGVGLSTWRRYFFQGATMPPKPNLQALPTPWLRCFRLHSFSLSA